MWVRGRGHWVIVSTRFRSSGHRDNFYRRAPLGLFGQNPAIVTGGRWGLTALVVVKPLHYAEANSGHQHNDRQNCQHFTHEC